MWNHIWDLLNQMCISTSPCRYDSGASADGSSDPCSPMIGFPSIRYTVYRIGQLRPIWKHLTRLSSSSYHTMKRELSIQTKTGDGRILSIDYISISNAEIVRVIIYAQLFKRNCLKIITEIKLKLIYLTAQIRGQSRSFTPIQWL